MQGVRMRQWLVGACAVAMAIEAPAVMASAFQLWEQDGASVGHYHAGYAAEANDASTAFYNPAGLTRFQNQQIVIAANSVLTNLKYVGSIRINSVDNNAPQTVTAQGGSFSVIPAIHYVTPLSSRVNLGFSVDVPFGSITNYGKSTFLRYVSTQTSLMVIDASPSLGIKVTDHASIGFGPDVQSAKAEFNQVGTLGDPVTDSDGINKATGTGYGAHAGALYEFTPTSRVGLSYHSQVVFHLTGNSLFTGPIPSFFDGDVTSTAKLKMTLPPYTALSAYHHFNPKVAVMGSVIYTQWSTIKTIVLQNVAGLSGGEPSTNIVVTIPQYFRNTWNYSAGMDYLVSDQVKLRSGVGYDQTPVINGYRTAALPDNSRVVVAFGGHYQATKAVGLDVSWSHVFVNKAHIGPPLQVTGDESVETNGSVSGGADVFGAQVVWDMV